MNSFRKPPKEVKHTCHDFEPTASGGMKFTPNPAAFVPKGGYLFYDRDLAEKLCGCRDNGRSKDDAPIITQRTVSAEELAKRRIREDGTTIPTNADLDSPLTKSPVPPAVSEPTQSISNKTTILGRYMPTASRFYSATASGVISHIIGRLDSELRFIRLLSRMANSQKESALKMLAKDPRLTEADRQAIAKEAVSKYSYDKSKAVTFGDFVAQTADDYLLRPKPITPEDTRSKLDPEAAVNRLARYADGKMRFFLPDIAKQFEVCNLIPALIAIPSERLDSEISKGRTVRDLLRQIAETALTPYLRDAANLVLRNP